LVASYDLPPGNRVGILSKEKIGKGEDKVMKKVKKEDKWGSK